MEWYWKGKTEAYGEKHIPVQLCSALIPREPSEDWTLASMASNWLPEPGMVNACFGYSSVIIVVLT
jgi:hypothetical protein